MTEEFNEIKCEFCDKIFTTKSNLIYHQKNTRSCLEKQGKKKKYICNFCERQLSTNDRLLSHLNKCKEKIKIKELELKIKELELKIKELETLNKQKDVLIMSIFG